MQFIKSTLSIILVFCAVLMTLLVVRREFQPSQLHTQHPDRVLPDSLWRIVSEYETAIGPESAPVRIVEFLDYECIFCQRFHPVLDSIRTKYSAQVAIVYRNFPLNYHTGAYLSAMAAECAAHQSKFETYQNLLFQNLDALSNGTIDRIAIAKAAQISDLNSFQECMTDGKVQQKVNADTVLAGKLGIGSIPTIFVNGAMYSGLMTFPELDVIVKKELAK